MIDSLTPAKILGIRAPSAQSAVEAALAAVCAGLQVIELTFTTPDLQDALKSLKKRLSSKLVLGAGTVMNPQQAEVALGAGADFLVSPHLGLDVLEVARQGDIPYIPGVLRPGEIATASSLGIRLVKRFPLGSAGGGPYLKDLFGPFSELKVVVTGDIKPNEVELYLQAGDFALGLGSKLFPKVALESGDWAAVERATRSSLKEAGVA